MLSALRPLSFALIASTLALACGGGQVIQVNGVEIYEKYWNKALKDLTPRASFDLHCPENGLSFTLFRKDGRQASEVGVSGCGSQLTYVRVANTWYSNAESGSAAAAQEKEKR